MKCELCGAYADEICLAIPCIEAEAAFYHEESQQVAECDDDLPPPGIVRRRHRQAMRAAKSAVAKLSGPLRNERKNIYRATYTKKFDEIVRDERHARARNLGFR